jgi:hypothetical protein
MRRVLTVCAALLALDACRSTPPPAPAPPQPPDDSAYDWHPLLIAPLGSVLKEVPLALHEVLLFRDDPKAAADEGECYGSDAKPPALLGRTPDEYTLCFKRDRLSRIQATVRLPRDEAADLFAKACAAWLRHATADAGAECAGRDGAVHFTGRLGDDSEAAEDVDTALSLTLDGVNP